MVSVATLTVAMAALPGSVVVGRRLRIRVAGERAWPGEGHRAGPGPTAAASRGKHLDEPVNAILTPQVSKSLKAVAGRVVEDRLVGAFASRL